MKMQKVIYVSIQKPVSDDKSISKAAEIANGRMKPGVMAYETILYSMAVVAAQAI
jgi:hypothetical protein